MRIMILVQFLAVILLINFGSQTIRAVLHIDQKWLIGLINGALVCLVLIITNKIKILETKVPMPLGVIILISIFLLPFWIVL
ncbi:hypothetical protein [Mesobacillus foraminis]|nr:hypothetical protein [Mesobacillus foraminis]